MEKTRVSWSVFDPCRPDVYYSVSRWIDGLSPAKTSVSNDAWSVSANAEILPEMLPTGVFFAVDVRFEIHTYFRFKHSLVLQLPP
jgi:hypothetical protein